MMYFESTIHSIIHLFNLQLYDFREIVYEFFIFQIVFSIF